MEEPIAGTVELKWEWVAVNSWSGWGLWTEDELWRLLESEEAGGKEKEGLVWWLKWL